MFHYLIYDLKIRWKFVLSFLPVFLIALTFFLIYFYTFLFNVIEKQLDDISHHLFQQTQLSLANTLDTYYTLTLSLGVNNEIEAAIEEVENDNAPNVLTRNKNRLRQNAYALICMTKSDGCRLYFNDEFPPMNDQSFFYNFCDTEDAEWFSNLFSRYERTGNNFYICAPSELPENAGRPKALVSFARIIKSKEDYKKVIGVFRVDLAEEELLNLLSSSNFAENSNNFLISESGTLVTATGKLPPDISEYIEREGLLKSTNYTAAANSTFHEVTSTDGRKYLLRLEPVRNYGLYLGSVIDRKDFLALVDKLSRQFGLSTLVLMAFCTSLIYAISQTMVRRFLKLRDTMMSVKTGELRVFDKPAGRDEIGQLTESYNYLVHRTKILLQEEYRHGIELKNAELKILQEQINPHFLYNTLEMIGYFAQNQCSEKAVAATNALVAFYRTTLSGGKELISVDEELQNVQSYMLLQNMRYHDAVNFTIQMPDEMKTRSIVKMTLQPIVENAVSHGIMEKESKSGNIRIAGWMEHGVLRLTVADDGVGMPPELLEGLLAGTASSGNRGYGLRNVQLRLLTTYGPGFGLSFQSIEGRGTIVTITFPDHPYEA